MQAHKKTVVVVIGALLLIFFIAQFTKKQHGSRDIASVQTGQAQEQNNLNLDNDSDDRLDEDSPLHQVKVEAVRKPLTSEKKDALKVVMSEGGSPQEKPRASTARYKDWVEVAGAKARKKSNYKAQMGEKVSEQSGYVIFNSPSSRASLTEFNNAADADLPVVRRGRNPVLGLVTGDIAVQFREYPDSIHHFADKNGLRVVAEYKHLNRVILAPKNSPENLIELTNNLNRQNEVEAAELSVIFNRLKVR